jgi:hypothetical protein
MNKASDNFMTDGTGRTCFPEWLHTLMVLPPPVLVGIRTSRLEDLGMPGTMAGPAVRPDWRQVADRQNMQVNRVTGRGSNGDVCHGT